MLSKKFTSRTLLTKVVLGVIFFVLLLLLVHSWSIVNRAPVQPLVITTKAEEPTDVTTPVIISNPVRLFIPRIELEAAIQQVGTKVSGEMAVPTNFTDVGWYKDGYEPGTRGNSVIAGHETNGLGLPAVFSNLSSVQVGDLVYVDDANNERLTFKVTELATYEYDKAPLQKIFGPASIQKLNLITCSGEWLPTLKTNAERLVVYTELVPAIEIEVENL